MINKIISNGVVIEWTRKQRDAESAFKEAPKQKEWWLVAADGTAKLIRKG